VNVRAECEVVNSQILVQSTDYSVGLSTRTKSRECSEMQDQSGFSRSQAAASENYGEIVRVLAGLIIHMSSTGNAESSRGSLAVGRWPNPPGPGLTPILPSTS